jgi:hypothetical protein
MPQQFHNEPPVRKGGWNYWQHRFNWHIERDGIIWDIRPELKRNNRPDRLMGGQNNGTTNTTPDDMRMNRNTGTTGNTGTMGNSTGTVGH